MSSPTRDPTPQRQLYFAYGSNLWLQQMLVRCPNSYCVGRAILPDYRWQINERGYANVIPASGYTVHGLVYELDESDESSLDRNEGVSTGDYSKAYRTVIMHPTVRGTQERTTGMGGKEAILQSGVLVYLSYNYIHAGQPRDEYVKRLNFGIEDGVFMGIPDDYFDNAVRGLLSHRPSIDGSP